ncbi:hypothetical protein BDV32DRAFT_159057 [Aspergillus pseudonomiae]|uniref:Uncharacterized protein n=1 Tax=Aspergillus pseudonomiae TaxID=1506151 RepID=A0A5N6I029_9EURO|nr:uncharacterized protein BDV37DRAFT_297351 [Aspergillus pseudonomiae]KAB8259996.1 hypothetical protein BDV32DRAFT_159057 [Aspergillus pseudonomiae]KAE8407715.1 hypothetical protein BDV37DRAFT_297351 [Aspergillus pseudonomiae]
MHTLYLYTILALFWSTLTTATETTRTPLQVTFLPPTTNNTPIIVDTFTHPDKNHLGSWHGALEDLTVTQGRDYIELNASNADQTYHSQLSSTTCFDLTPYKTWILHIVYSGPPTFSVSLHQNNPSCNPSLNPYPETSDSIEASRYTAKPHWHHRKPKKQKPQDLYVPLSHFTIDQSRVLSISLGGFYPPYTRPIKVYKVELIPALPRGVKIPKKKQPTGQLRLRCTRPGSFAFGIDDGIPSLADEVREILESEGVLVTFFVVGGPLRDNRTGFADFYRKMVEGGHQIALHSDAHSKMEGMESTKAIDDDIFRNIATFKDLLGVESSYFRPPYGTIGPRTRQILAKRIKNPQIINWSVDIEDWRWADSDTPERQLKAFYRDVDRGGNLAVLHYLSNSTVGYFRDIIHYVQGKGLKIMRIDQCLEDPKAPELL